MMTIKKNDTVAIIKGKDKGKRGAVLEIIPGKNKVMVQGVNMVKRHTKPRKEGEKGGIVEREAYIAYANVMPICRSCKIVCRINVVEQGDKRFRACNRCKNPFEE